MATAIEGFKQVSTSLSPETSADCVTIRAATDRAREALLREGVHAAACGFVADLAHAHYPSLTRHIPPVGIEARQAGKALRIANPSHELLTLIGAEIADIGGIAPGAGRLGGAAITWWISTAGMPYVITKLGQMKATDAQQQTKPTPPQETWPLAAAALWFAGRAKHRQTRLPLHIDDCEKLLDETLRLGRLDAPDGAIATMTVDDAFAHLDRSVLIHRDGDAWTPVVPALTTRII